MTVSVGSIFSHVSHKPNGLSFPRSKSISVSHVAQDFSSRCISVGCYAGNRDSTVASLPKLLSAPVAKKRAKKAAAK